VATAPYYVSVEKVMCFTGFKACFLMIFLDRPRAAALTILKLTMTDYFYVFPEYIVSSTDQHG
jgi:hypothetical protein